MKTLTQTNIERLKDLIKETENKIQNFDKSEYLTDEKYDEMLDDCYGEVNICGMTFYSSVAFRELDPIAYRCGFSDFADSMDNDEFEEYTELQEELKELQEELKELESDNE
jgi:uncharacterized protein YlxW (UPF0749 family)